MARLSEFAGPASSPGGKWHLQNPEQHGGRKTVAKQTPSISTCLFAFCVLCLLQVSAPTRPQGQACSAFSPSFPSCSLPGHANISTHALGKIGLCSTHLHPYSQQHQASGSALGKGVSSTHTSVCREQIPLPYYLSCYYILLFIFILLSYYLAFYYPIISL